MIEYYVNNYYKNKTLSHVMEELEKDRKDKNNDETRIILTASVVIAFFLTANTNRLPAIVLNIRKTDAGKDFIIIGPNLLYTIKLFMVYNDDDVDGSNDLLIHLDKDCNCRVYQTNSFKQKYNLKTYYQSDHKHFGKQKNSFLSGIDKIIRLLKNLLEIQTTRNFTAR